MGETIDQLRASFIEETRDLINELEDVLLSIEIDSVDSDTIDQIFRSVHTIKGSGGMLGFDKVLEVTHDLEDIYDKVRAGAMPFSLDLKDISLETIDIIKQLLATNENLSNNDKIRFADLCRKIELFDLGKSDDAKPGATNASEKASQSTKVATYTIRITTDGKLPKELSHPKYLVEELTLLGKSVAFSLSNNSVEVDSFEKAGKRAEWLVFLSTAALVEHIENIFDWAESAFTLSIDKISNGDLLAIEGARDELLQYKNEVFDNTSKVVSTLIDKFSAKLTPVEDKASKTKADDKCDDSKSKAGENMISSIRVATDKIDQLMNLVSEMVTLQARLNLLADEIDDERLSNIAEKYSSFSRQLRDNAFTISLVPFGVTITRYKRLVHDLSVQLDKKVDFLTEGEDTVLDKKIIEHLTDPIMHILRNCVDHGIESEAERKKAGKPENGQIQMKIFHQSNNVIIKIIDDGKGIDPEVIRKVAIKRKLITADQIITDDELINMIFLPGFSSAKSISNVSGRGVGLDVVKRNISNIRGTIDIQTKKGGGTTFSIKLPLTLSIIDGLQVKIDERDFIIPLIQVDKIVALEKLTQESTLSQVITIDGAQIPYFDLRNDFEIGGTPPERREMVVVSFENEKVSLIVDRVVGENQTVLKSLGKHYENQDFLAGGTILGDGSVALVLDINKIVTGFSKK
ncbi:MAG: chemotaxis protein CheA [Prolixibacteraceae bacterium]|nr:chemotaxis protein CheA [Prolixibacteraceae bacterium]MBN2648689.1 chemotaxis protein CheA [Prolixibacteraceae bacterium]